MIHIGEGAGKVKVVGKGEGAGTLKNIYKPCVADYPDGLLLWRGCTQGRVGLEP